MAIKPFTVESRTSLAVILLFVGKYRTLCIACRVDQLRLIVRYLGDTYVHLGNVKTCFSGECENQKVEAEDCWAEAALEAGPSASVEPFHLGHGKCASIGLSQETNQMGTIC